MRYSGVVTFDPASWKLRYPEFTSVPDALAQLYFNEATIYVDNTALSPVYDLAIRTTLLNMVTAHIAKLNALDTNNQPTNPLVGRISDAAEGTVSVKTEFTEAKSGTQAWFFQTQYGAAYWAAAAPYRQFHYVPARGPQPSVFNLVPIGLRRRPY